jgi:hypothetical protein
METSQNMKKSTCSGRIAKPHPQSDWDSFSLTTCIPKDKKWIFPLPTGMARIAQEGRTVDASFPHQHVPWRSGRQRKNKEARENLIPYESHA